MRSGMEAHSAGSVLLAPFTEELLIARVGGLVNIEAAASEIPPRNCGNGLIAASVRISSGTAVLHLHERQQASLGPVS